MNFRVFIRAVKTNKMADARLSVNDRVSIDGKGAGVVKSLEFRGFGTFYNVQIEGSDYETELPIERLEKLDATTIEPPTELNTPQQTTESTRVE